MSVDHRQRGIDGWEALVNGQKVAGGLDKFVTVNPIGAVKRCLVEKHFLSDNTAIIVAGKLVKFLEERNLISRLDTTHFKLSQLEMPDFSGFNATSASSTSNKVNLVEKKGEDNGKIQIPPNPQSPNKFEELATEIADLRKVIIKNCSQPMIAREPTVAICMDGPNFGKSIEECGSILRASISILKDQALKYRSIVSSFVFQNQGCPVEILREFERSNYTTITCIRGKDQYEDGYDPVDIKMLTLIRDLVFIADTYIVVTEDRDFCSLIERITDSRNKRCIRVSVDKIRRLLVIQEKDQEKLAELPKRSLQEIVINQNRMNRSRFASTAR